MYSHISLHQFTMNVGLDHSKQDLIFNTLTEQTYACVIVQGKYINRY